VNNTGTFKSFTEFIIKLDIHYVFNVQLYIKSQHMNENYG